jgi:hypothetical protein
MAHVNDAPALHRKHAAKVPADVLDRLTAGELRARCRHAHSYEEKAGSEGDPAQFRYLRMHQRKILAALPAVEVIHEAQRLNEVAADSPAQLRCDEAGNNYSIRGAVMEKRRRLLEENPLPPGLHDAIERAMLGRSTGYPDLDALALACIGAYQP